ncbi:chondroitin sulfate glucuronyltransferase [Culicoides brevitarsis]|uniref:chondroitin sulfate glucuronyltransferase n=1 Tax=Culicoides brevitarsis TaxID=469753 RepID=UPI00307B6A22
MLRLSSVSSKQCFFIGVVLGLLVTFKIQDVQDASSKATCTSITLENADFNNEFEPQVNLAGKPMQAKKTAKNIVRPRYYSSELGIREKVFVAVLTKVDTINTVSPAFNKTTAHLVNRIKFFINADSVNVNIKMKNIVGFTDTRDNLRTYHVLKYIADNYITDYDYFFLVPDTSYVNARSLVEKLEKISVSSDIYMGTVESPGSSSYEDGAEASRYCDINAGIVLSNSVVKKIRANLDWCVRNAAQSNRHSVNLGKCIKYSTTEIQECQTTWQNVTVGSYRLNNYKIYRDLHYLRMEKAFNEAVVVHPITNPDDFYLLHTYFTRVNLENLREKMSRNLEEYENVKLGHLPDSLLEKHWPIGVPESKPAETRHDLISWDFLNETHIFMWNAETNVKELPLPDKQDIDKILNRTVSYALKKYPELIYDNVHSIYRKFDPVRGMDYILHLNFVRRDSNLHSITKSFEISKPLGSVEIISSPYVTESTKIQLIIPVFEQHIDEAIEILSRYESICLTTQENTYLTIVFLYQPTSPNTGPADIFASVKQKIVNLKEKYKASSLGWYSIRSPVKLSTRKMYTSMYGPSEIVSLGVIDLALRKTGLDSIILMMPNDARFRVDFLNRVRMNTIAGFQVYSPISVSNYPCKFTQFCRDCDSCDVSQANGYFDSQNFDILAFYGKDYVEARKKLESKVPVVKQDRDIQLLVDLKQEPEDKVEGVIDIFLKSPLDIHILRAIEPNLRTGMAFSNYLMATGDTPQCVKENLGEEFKCRRLGSKKQLSEAVAQYEDEVVKGVK